MPSSPNSFLPCPAPEVDMSTSLIEMFSQASWTSWPETELEDVLEYVQRSKHLMIPADWKNKFQPETSA